MLRLTIPGNRVNVPNVPVPDLSDIPVNHGEGSGGSSGGGSGSGVSPEILAQYLKLDSEQPQNVESDLVIGATHNISITNTNQAANQAVPKRYVDEGVGALQQHYTDLEGRVAVNESDLTDVRPLLEAAPGLVYACSDLPSKENLVLNLTPEVFKRGVPNNSFALDIHSCLPTMPSMVNLQYAANQNQQTFGVTTGFNDNNRGYSPTEGYWYIGKNTRINYVSIQNLNLTQTTGLTFEIEFEILNNPTTEWTCPFGISTLQTLGADPSNATHKQRNNIRVEWSGSQFEFFDHRGSNLLGSANMGNAPLNTKINMIFTLEGQTLKGYRDFVLQGTGSVETYTDSFKWIFLNRGSNSSTFANMKVHKLRLWSGVLTAEQIATLANK